MGREGRERGRKGGGVWERGRGEGREGREGVRGVGGG